MTVSSTESNYTGDDIVTLDWKEHIRRRPGMYIGKLKKILADGGSLIIMSHMGKPKGKVNPKFSLSQIKEDVAKALGTDVIFADDCAKAADKAAALKPGEVLLLEVHQILNDADLGRHLRAAHNSGKRTLDIGKNIVNSFQQRRTYSDLLRQGNSRRMGRHGCRSRIMQGVHSRYSSCQDHTLERSGRCVWASENAAIGRFSIYRMAGSRPTLPIKITF